ncbi:thioesterase superfamily protein-like protein [Trichodelitschia bisporula]|uniref:Thioesterase superfamily protein-like protein n=1 Tax=Trichodelitschia bisporula TaxID=703511 RepID=A0A6G1HNV0_9PEZI|nr:thioesterase superfamily protein-like protein [Trichodelitschia bisporula]
MAHLEKKNRKRSDYKYQLEYRTRWSDNDMYHHMNNTVYGQLFDAIINDYLIKYCGRRPVNPQTQENGIVVTSYCDFFGSVSYPDVIDACLRVNKLGKTSVTYEVGIFQQGFDDVRAVGGFTHVFCDQKTGRPMPQGMSKDIREGLEKLLVPSAAKL